MVQFAYKARDSRGLAKTGIREASDEMVLVKELGALGYKVTHVEVKQPTLQDYLLAFKRRRNVSQQEIILFSRQLATLLKSGLPLTTALKSVIEQVEKEKFKGALQQILKDVEAGTSLSESLRKHPSIFNQFYVSMIKVGETAGILDEVLERLIQLNSQELDLKVRLRAAMIYPVILVTVSVLIVGFLMVKIVPRFVTIFETYEAKLPLSTKILLTISAIVTKCWLIILIGLVVLGLWMSQYMKSTKGKERMYTLLLKLPLFGKLYLKVIISRFARTLGALVKSGVSILEALSVTEKTIHNIIISGVVQDIRLGASQGKTLSELFQTSGIFPPMVVQMVNAGEKSGKLDVMLSDVANYYDQEVEYTLKNAATTLEPILLLVMGSMVAFIALSILLPIFNLIKVFRGTL